MATFWGLYANVTDDVRHQLIEEAWFGRRVTGDTSEQDMPGIADAGQNSPAATQPPARGWGTPSQGPDIHGNNAAPEPDIGITPPDQGGPEPEL